MHNTLCQKKVRASCPVLHLTFQSQWLNRKLLHSTGYCKMQKWQVPLHRKYSPHVAALCTATSSLSKHAFRTWHELSIVLQCRKSSKHRKCIGQNKENSWRLNQRQYRTIQYIAFLGTVVITELPQNWHQCQHLQKNSTPPLTPPQAVATGRPPKTTAPHMHQAQPPTRKMQLPLPYNLYNCCYPE